MIQFILDFFCISGLSILLAWLEIEIEGPNGWAKNTATAELKAGPVFILFRFILGQRPVTVYHVYIFTLVMLFFHQKFFSGVEWNLTRELICLAHYLTTAALWDYLWFIYNPHYGKEKFHRKYIWWHADGAWLFCKPLDYYQAWAGSIILAYLATKISGSYSLLIYHLLLLVCLYSITIGLSLKYANKYHAWHQSLRK